MRDADTDAECSETLPASMPAWNEINERIQHRVKQPESAASSRHFLVPDARKDFLSQIFWNLLHIVSITCMLLHMLQDFFLGLAGRRPVTIHTHVPACKSLHKNFSFFPQASARRMHSLHR
jgi:hypothetical protein